MKQKSHEIKFGDTFYHEPSDSFFECVGTDDGMIWGAKDDYSEAKPFEKCDCEKSEPCPECEGTGQIEGKTGGSEGIPEADVMFVCNECGGSGKIKK